MKKNEKKIRIEFTNLFNKQRKDAPLEIKIAFQETLELFLEEPKHETLRRHLLKGEYFGYESIDVTPDYRAVFKETRIERKIVIKFYTIGTHEELYGK